MVKVNVQSTEKNKLANAMECIITYEARRIKNNIRMNAIDDTGYKVDLMGCNSNKKVQSQLKDRKMLEGV